jgi:predicted AAA+ superfamily ATPase
VAETALYPRYTEPRLIEALAGSPVVPIHGPRQSGKTTLAQMAGEPRRYTYVSFDDDVARGAAEADPIGFVADLPERAILDEVQPVPALFTALKTAVDRKRVAGRFMLTGSANVLLVPKLADSLTGRMEIMRPHPLEQCELARRARSRPHRLARRAAATRRTRGSANRAPVERGRSGFAVSTQSYRKGQALPSPARRRPVCRLRVRGASRAGARAGWNRVIP